MILLISKDLFFAPVVKSAAAQHELEVVLGPQPTAERFSELDSDQVLACIVDLSAISLDEIQAACSSLRTTWPGAKLAAFGPHVQERRLVAARAAGFDVVLSRGQLHQNVGSLIDQWKTSDG